MGPWLSTKPQNYFYCDRSRIVKLNGVVMPVLVWAKRQAMNEAI